MTRAAPLPAICVAGILAACGALGAQSDSPAPILVKGTEHIAWDQTAPRGGWIVGFRFTAYVDGEPQPLPDATCSPVFCSQCGCTAPLPQMSAGTHRIEMTARDVFGNESARSAPIAVTLASAATQTSHAATIARPQIATTSTGASPAPTIDVLSSTLKNPSAIAVAPDGRIFIAERDGAIVIWKHGSVQVRPAAIIDAVVAADARLVDITLHPEFSTNARAFVAYTAREGDGAFANRIVRYREVDGVLGEAAVIFEDRVREPPLRTPRIRFGPDRKLYVLFPRGANVGGSGSYAGKVLRLNEDGSTPADNPGSTPVTDGGPASSTAFDWQPETHAMWRSDRASAMAFYPDGRSATSTLIEVGVDGGDEVTTRWFGNGYGRINDLVVGPDGALYFCGVNEKTRAGVLARVLER